MKCNLRELGRGLLFVPLVFLSVTASFAQSVQVIVETRIKNKIGSVQAGMKSSQAVTIDFSHKTLTSSFMTGSTHIGPFELHSIRDRFSVTSIQFAGEVASFQVQGETASGVGFMPNINYRFDITVDNRSKEMVYSGCHDGYPSYSITAGPKLMYSFEQELATALFGSCDVVVPSTTRMF